MFLPCSCFISNIGVFFGAYFGPVLALVVFNTVIFIVVIAVLMKHTRKRSQREDSSAVKTTVHTLIRIIGIMSIFGLTWLFGAFTVTQKTQLVFLILFVLFSSFQGFFIFAFLCVFNKDTRELWIQFFRHGRHNKRADSSKYLYISRGRSTLPKHSTSDSTASTTLKYSSDRYSTQRSSQPCDDYNMQKIEMEMCHTTDKAVYLNKGALDIDTEVSTNTMAA